MNIYRFGTIIKKKNNIQDDDIEKIIETYVLFEEHVLAWLFASWQREARGNGE